MAIFPQRILKGLRRFRLANPFKSSFSFRFDVVKKYSLSSIQTQSSPSCSLRFEAHSFSRITFVLLACYSSTGSKSSLSHSLRSWNCYFRILRRKMLCSFNQSFTSILGALRLESAAVEWSGCISCGVYLNTISFFSSVMKQYRRS
jgi:hypothetical protein